MSRNIGIERVYNLGEYKSLRIIDYVNDIPDELALNKEFMGVLRFLQLSEVEEAYYQYALQSKQIKDENNTDGERLITLTKLTNELYDNLQEIIKTNLKKE